MPAARAIAVVLLLIAPAFPLARTQAPASTIDWKRITLPFDTTGLVYPVWLYNPATKSTFVGAHQKGLFETKDAGDTWTRVDDGSFVTSPFNTDEHTLSAGPAGALYSIDIHSGVYRSTNAGRSWTKVFPRMGIKGRIWIDADRPAIIHAMVERATDDEPARVVSEFERSTDGGKTFEKLDLRIPETTSVDVAGRLVCYAVNAIVHCSENGTTWQTLSLLPIASSIAKDRDLNQVVRVTINKVTRELVLLSGGTLYETRNGRTVIDASPRAPQTPGRIIDVLFDPATTFPAYGIAGVDGGGAWRLTKVPASGATDAYAGPKPTGIRLHAVDRSRNIFYVWTLEGYHRGILK